jgi:hypothetical protein
MVVKRGLGKAAVVDAELAPVTFDDPGVANVRQKWCLARCFAGRRRLEHGRFEWSIRPNQRTGPQPLGLDFVFLERERLIKPHYTTQEAIDGVTRMCKRQQQHFDGCFGSNRVFNLNDVNRHGALGYDAVEMGPQLLAIFGGHAFEEVAAPKVVSEAFVEARAGKPVNEITYRGALKNEGVWQYGAQTPRLDVKPSGRNSAATNSVPVGIQQLTAFVVH